MKSIWKKIETASPEEAALLRDALLHQLWKSAFFALAAVSVIAFATIAWFVSNTQVHSGTAAVSSGFEPIKLATKGVRQDADQYLKELLENKGDEVKTQKYNNETYYYTDGGSIALRLDVKDYEVSPGARGKVTFYVIPTNASGSMTLHIGLGGYGEIEKEDKSKEVVQINDSVLNALLSGHILLFNTFENDVYSDWLFQDAGDGYTGIFNNTITVDLSSADAGQPIEVDFYWIWPLRYENLEALLTAEEFGKLQADSLKTHDMLNEKYKYSRVFLVEQQGNLIDDKNRSNAYDLADEYIGGNAQYLYLTIQTDTSENTEGGQSS